MVVALRHSNFPLVLEHFSRVEPTSMRAWSSGQIPPTFGDGEDDETLIPLFQYNLLPNLMHL